MWSIFFISSLFPVTGGRCASGCVRHLSGRDQISVCDRAVIWLKLCNVIFIFILLRDIFFICRWPLLEVNEPSEIRRFCRDPYTRLMMKFNCRCHLPLTSLLFLLDSNVIKCRISSIFSFSFQREHLAQRLLVYTVPQASSHVCLCKVLPQIFYFTDFILSIILDILEK